MPPVGKRRSTTGRCFFLIDKALSDMSQAEERNRFSEGSMSASETANLMSFYRMGVRAFLLLKRKL